MKILNYDIPEDLFARYLMAIKNLQVGKSLDWHFYAMLDHKRADLHDEILKAINVPRENMEFKRALAMKIEDFIY